MALPDIDGGWKDVGYRNVSIYLLSDHELNEAYYHSGDRWRWCEYIAFRGLWRIAFARVHESDITDTELQVGHIVIVTSIDANSMHGTGWQVHASKTRRASNLRKQSGAVLAYRGK